MNSIKISAPAKVNLFLKVLNRRKDGYHNIITLFERISLADEIEISKIPHGIRFKSDKPITADPKDNLAYKAAESILKYAKAGKGVQVKLKKNIPIAAGLGGGSSDAASTLMGINKLYNLKLGQGVLIKLAKKLGADVPFFILDKPFAIARGIGDRLKVVNSDLVLWHLIVCTGSKISTARIYGMFDASSKCLTGCASDDKISRSLRQKLDFNTVESMLYNDLKEAAVASAPVTGTILERLAYTTGRRAMMSGSGPSVFCLNRSRKEALKAKRKLLTGLPAGNKNGWQVFITKTYN